MPVQIGAVAHNFSDPSVSTALITENFTEPILTEKHSSLELPIPLSYCREISCRFASRRVSLAPVG
jgi:hypothetical protein